MKARTTLDLRHPANAGALRYLRSRAKPVEADRPYLRLGSHPDVIERVWDGLGASLPGKGRGIAYGTPALLSPRRGVLRALARGTSYALRLGPEAYAEAVRRGAETRHHYATSRVTLDLATEFGPGWIFGAWATDEPTRFTEAGALLDAAPPDPAQGGAA